MPAFSRPAKPPLLVKAIVFAAYVVLGLTKAMAPKSEPGPRWRPADLASRFKGNPTSLF